jgi:hypothetical protein
MRSLSLIGLSSLIACSSAEVDGPLPWDGPPSSSDSGVISSGLTCPQAGVMSLADCERSERSLADDAVSVGFGADEFLGLISGEHSAVLSWESNGSLSGRSSELVLTVEPLGDVRFVDQEARDNSGGGGVITFGNTGGRYLACGDRLAVDARIRISTADGALNEVIETTVEADSGRYARLRATLLAEQIAGSLEPSVESGQGRARTSPVELSLVFGISELGLEAALGAHAEFEGTNIETGSPCNIMGGALLDRSCPWGSVRLGVGEEIFGLSLDRAVAQLNASSPATLADSGARLELSADATPEPRCVSVDTPAVLPYVTQFPGRVLLQSSDGRVGGAMDVQLQAEALDGALRVTASTSYLVPVADELPELAPSYAILQPLVWSELEHGGFEFFAEATGRSSGGVLRAIGSDLTCNGTRPCEEVCPGPGCTATNAEKWAVRWGELSNAAAVSLAATPPAD